MLKKILFVLLISFIAIPNIASAERFQVNNNYHEIFPSYPDSKPGRVTVREFFWYRCPHCYEFEPFLNKWLKDKPENVDFILVPAAFGKIGRLHAQLFYALEAMGIESKLHEKIFNAIHNQRRNLDSLDNIKAFLKEQDVDMAAFDANFNSFGVVGQVNRANALSKQFGITGVPSLVVDGRYRNGRTQNFNEKIELLNFMIKKAQENKN